MTTEPDHPDNRAERRAASEGSPGFRPQGGPEEQTDMEEDRRRQRELDDGELGGEA